MNERLSWPTQDGILFVHVVRMKLNLVTSTMMC